MIVAETPTKSNPFANPRDFLANRFVYLTISPRARGLSVGVNFNPDRHCNFDCVYCEVDRRLPAREATLDVEVMAQELQSTIQRLQNGELQKEPPYQSLPDHLLQVRHVALSGDGEPTQCPNFLDAVHAVLHLRALGRVPFFKVVLITNSSGLDRPEVQEGIGLFTARDEVWAKLDAGTEEYKNKVNRTEVPLSKLLENILLVGRSRPVVIQSLFSSVQGEEPSLAEVTAYADRLACLGRQGAKISLVQIYSASRPIWNEACQHLSLRRLSQIAEVVRERTGLKVEVF